MVDLTKAPFWLDKSEISWVEDLINQMTEDEKIGQLFCLMGDEYSEEERQKLLKEYFVGGILFRPVQGDMQKARFEDAERCSKYPLLKAANLEQGGAGAALDATCFGQQMQVAATDNPEIAEKFGKVCLVEGAQVGVNWTFSPICDLDMNYLNPITNVRTFGSDLARVITMSNMYVKTVQAGGIAACAKHFPGDGVDFRDQHLHTTWNTLSAQKWYETYGEVYRTMIENGLLGVMVGHIGQENLQRDINPEIEEDKILPASLSPELLQGVLRQKYGFNGIIVTDATIMGGYTQAMRRSDALPRSINAGIDMFVFSTNIYEDIKSVKLAVENGTIPRERLDDAMRRILALKAWCKREKHLPQIQAAKWQKECADQSVTLVKDLENALPVTPDRYPKLQLVALGKDEMNDGGSLAETAKKLFEEQGFEVKIMCPEKEELTGPGSLTKDKVNIYLCNYVNASNQTVVRINWYKKHAIDSPKYPNEETEIFISFANPYHLIDVPAIKTYINAYTATHAVVEAVVEKLMGKSKFTGVSPVDAFCGLKDTKR